MKLLLDTHLLLWVANDPSQLSQAALSWIDNPSHEVHFSAASLWEIVIKHSLGRADFHADPILLRCGLLSNGYQELLITCEHALGVSNLPNIHRDPFDRILIAQATLEDMLLLTADPLVASYPGPIHEV